MNRRMQKIVTNLWFDGRVEEALDLYTSLFADSRVTNINPLCRKRHGRCRRHHDGGFRIGRPSLHHHQWRAAFPAQPGHVAAGPLRRTRPRSTNSGTALIAAGGEPSRCGWLVDPFGVSWQITPTRLGELLASDDSAAVERVTQAFLKMDKLNIAATRAGIS